MKLVIVPAALKELQDTVAFYTSNASPTVAAAFVDEFERAVNLIFSAPLLGAIFHGTRRRYFLRKFPYSVVYQITSAELRVIALAHQRRRPAYWRGRT